ncbi:hypothetical protein O3M35_011083 [Rhynocoris fuscipes]|uniref:SH3 domain-containing protein n=1 Tax=Rhynocoris fuscipes TaxID=488301 RepID=A0AAW1CXL6_9HEMI
MTSKNSGMKLTIPTRPAPSLPGNRMNLFNSSEISPSDPFSPLKYNSSQQDRKKPPPRPPPPKNLPAQVGNQRLSVFGSSKKKQQKAAATAIVKPLPPASNIPVGTLIDLQSPPSSPQFPSKLRSSTSVGNISNYTNNASLIESGFEDDFNSLLSSTATTPAFDPWSTNSDFTPSSSKTPSPDLGFPQPSIKYETKSKSFKQLAKSQTISKPPTIICVPSSTTGNSNYKIKPVRPPPPSNVSLFNVQNINTSGVFNKEGSPPMPCIPPPPPPIEALSVLASCPPLPPRPTTENKASIAEKEPYCVAEYDYESSHPDDLNFKTGDKIFLLEEINAEWLKGKLLNKQGIFPKSYVKIVVPLTDPIIMTVIAVYPFTAETWDDLDLKEGDKVNVLSRINKDWLYGECEGKRGQFPECYTQDITDLDVDDL